MEFNSLLKQLKDLNLPADEYIVVSSGALAVRNIRDARDLDIVVSDSLWQKLSQKYPVKNIMAGNNQIEQIEFGNKNIEVLGKGSAFRDPEIATTEELISTSDIIDGIHYINLPLLKKFKQKLSREKDLKDIELINQYLATHPK